MKRNAIARIVIYSVLALFLCGILLTGITIDLFSFDIDKGNSEVLEHNGSISVDGIRKMKIDWVAGDITILRGDTDKILLSETAPENCKYELEVTKVNNTLAVSYSAENIVVRFGVTIPSKSLTITVPQDWDCSELEINGAALDIRLQDLSIGSLELDGASCNLAFTGSINTVDVDGASNNLSLVCTDRVSEINVDGASCDLDLWLADGCGFRLSMDGLSCNFNSDLDYTRSGGDYRYGDAHCKIEVEGLSCDVTIAEAKELS